jgi:lysophospholipid acyltransferase (LPLAT)-like uncharacterized protein
MQPFLYKKLRDKRDIYAIISEHSDGEIIARLIEFFGFKSIRGSSKRGGVKALFGAMKKLKEANDIAITPDGPRGPRFSIANGVVAIAKKSNTKIIIFNYKVDKYWQLKSWDKFIIPKPFSSIEFFASEPFLIEDLGEEEAKIHIKNKLLENAMP